MEKQTRANCSSTKLGHDCFLSSYDLERIDGIDFIRVSSCCCLKVNFILYLIRCLILNSGSMEPAFQRGDILLLNNYNDPIRVGEIVVFKIKDRDIPIVHRVLKVHEKENGDV